MPDSARRWTRYATLLTTALGLATHAAADTADKLALDRKAILAMQGEYRVSFNFHETVVLAEDYERQPPQQSGANEVVLVIEDTPNKIVLQHILVSDDGKHVTKHWRQDWTLEAPTRFEFTADQTWTLQRVDPVVTRGAWTQCVYEVSDAPRYCGTGRWNHSYGVATWTSDRTWRPLPRREHTKRDDYNALNVENRHTIVPGGWTHEQDNTKVVRKPNGDSLRTLVREAGFNDYQRTSAVDFTPAYDYWNATKEYWQAVRSRWDAALAQPTGIRLKTKVDGMPLIEAFFEHAQRVQNGETIASAEIDAVFARLVERLPPSEVVATSGRQR